MLFETLGKLDLLTVIILMGAAIFPHQLLFAAAIYLLAKGIIFGFILTDFASKIDFMCGIYLVVLSNGVKVPILHTIVLIWLVQKTIMTFIAISLKLFVYYHEYKQELPAFLR